MTAVVLNVLFLFTLILILLYILHCIFNYIFDCNIMQSEDARFLKRKIVSGSIDVHPTEIALVVNYALEAHILNDSGNCMHSGKKEYQKVIKFNNLTSESDCGELARETIEQCSLIHPSKLTEITQLIHFLKSRSKRTGGKTKDMSPGPQPNISPPMQASIASVPQYVELLYEDIQDKIKGSALILQLARNPDNLVELSKNEALLSALSRVLREEWKRSIELSTNIVFTFFSFSTYNEFHSVILQYKIGSLCMDVIDFELKRFDQWKDTIEGKAKLGNSSDKNEPPKSRIPEPKRRPKSGTWAVSDANIGNKASRSLNTSYHEDLCNAGDSKPDEEQLKRKLKALTKRQEQLLRVAFYLLLNIADNIKVEEKMHKKDVVGLLTGALQRHSNTDLSILIVSFLLKLSVYKENKDAMVNHNFIDKLPNLLDRASTSPDLVNVTLRLLFNLTFDSKLRSRIVKIGLLPKLISYISDDKHTSIVTKILYHLSIDDRVKAMFAHTDCVTLVTDMVLVSRGDDVGPLCALAVNLALNGKCAVLMCGAGRLPALVTRAFRSTDLMLIKLVRNLSNHSENKPLFIDFVGDIAGAATTQPFVDEAFCVECMGILANILQPELDVLAIIRQYNLVSFIMNILDAEHECSEEVVMGVVLIAGSLAAEETGAAALCAGGGPSRLVSLLRQRQEDDDLVLQLVYAFRQLLRHPSSAAYLINNTEAPAYLIDLMLDKNVEIRKICEACLDIITQTNSEWADRIKVERFRCHNAQWLSVVETLGSVEGGTEGDMEGDLPPYLSPNYLSNHNLFHSGSQMSLATTDESDSVLGDGDSDLIRPNTRHGKDLEDVDFALMGNSGLLTRSHNSVDSDSIMAMEFPLQD